MDKQIVNKLNELASTHNQYKSISLRMEVANVLGWTEKKAKKMLKSHCNSLSLWLILSAKNLIDMSYADYFKFGLETDVYDETNFYTAKAFREDGYMNVRPQWFCKALGITMNPEYYYSHSLLSDTGELDNNFLYQIVIRGHFIAGYIQDNKIWIADTSYRGTGVKAEDYIGSWQFKYLTKVI